MEPSAHILLIDDDLDSLHVHRTVLEHAGFEVETANDGISGIRACRGGRPQLVLLDLMMPGMDGGQVLQQLRQDERTKTTPVIALTGVPEWLQDHREVSSEFDGVLLKPVPHEVLIRTVARLLAASA
jgi:two-component system response regulator RpaA